MSENEANEANEANDSDGLKNNIHEKHLEIVQGVVHRLAYNSFFIKGWTITLVSAILAVYASTKENSFLLIGALPVVLFWFLDAYYLWQEKLFRKLYNQIVSGKYPSDYSIDINRVDKEGLRYHNVLLNNTIWPIYVVMILIFVGLYCWLKFSCNA